MKLSRSFAPTILLLAACSTRAQTIAAHEEAVESECRDPSACSSPEGARAVIAGEGGTIEGIGARIDVPAGALGSSVEVVIAEGVDAPLFAEELQPVGPTYAFLPHGAQFSRPVTIALPIDPDAGDGVVIATASPGGAWTVISAVTRIGDVVIAEVDHFSYFVAVREGAGCNNGAFCCQDGGGFGSCDSKANRECIAGDEGACQAFCGQNGCECQAATINIVNGRTVCTCVGCSKRQPDPPPPGFSPCFQAVQTNNINRERRNPNQPTRCCVRETANGTGVTDRNNELFFGCTSSCESTGTRGCPSTRSGDCEDFLLGRCRFDAGIHPDAEACSATSRCELDAGVHPDASPDAAADAAIDASADASADAAPDASADASADAAPDASADAAPDAAADAAAADAAAADAAAADAAAADAATDDGFFNRACYTDAPGNHSEAAVMNVCLFGHVPGGFDTCTSFAGSCAAQGPGCRCVQTACRMLTTPAGAPLPQINAGGCGFPGYEDHPEWDVLCECPNP